MSKSIFSEISKFAQFRFMESIGKQTKIRMNVNESESKAEILAWNESVEMKKSIKRSSSSSATKKRRGL